MVSIVISGMPGTGSSTTAKLLAEKLNFNYFIAGDLFKSIGFGRLQDNPYSKEFLEISRRKNLVIPTFSASDGSEAALTVWNSPLGKDKVFHEAIDELQNTIAKRDNTVIEGKIAIKIIKDPSFKVWLSLSEESRIRRTAEKDSLSIEKATAIIKKRDKIEETEFQRMYGFSKNEQEKIADLVIFVENKSPEQIVSEILKKSQHKL